MKYTYQNLHGKNINRFKNKDNIVIDRMSLLDLNCCDKCGIIQHTWNELNRRGIEYKFEDIIMRLFKQVNEGA